MVKPLEQLLRIRPGRDGADGVGLLAASRACMREMCRMRAIVDNASLSGVRRKLAK